MLFRRISVSTDKAVATPADMPTHFFPEGFPEDPEELRERLEASDPIFRPIIVDALPILYRRSDVDRVHVYQRDHLPEGLASPWPVDLLFVESRSGVGHMIEHARGDHAWASEIDDADIIVLAHICEAVHESLPIVPWEDFMRKASCHESGETIIDWIADTDAKLWLRFSHSSVDGLFWGVTFTDKYSVDSTGFIPVQAIGVKELAAGRLQIVGLMDDIFLQQKQ